MAGMSTIDTDYRPDGPLGALYQGFNAANANDMAGLELVKQYLANQRESTMLPFDTRIKSMEATRADAAASPEMIDAYKRGYIGQNSSQEAAGKKALATFQSEADLTNKQNKNKLFSENLLSKLNALKDSTLTENPQQDISQIGFDMKPTPVNTKPPVDILSLNAHRNIPLITSELARAKKGSEAEYILKQELEREQRNASPAQPLNANNSPLVPSPPIRNGGITPGSSEYERLMQALVDTPELRAKLIVGDQKFDSSEFNQMLKLMMEREKLAAKQTGEKSPKTFEEFINRILVKKSQGIELTPEENAAWADAAGGFNAKNAAKTQPGNQVDVAQLPGVPLKEKPAQQQYVPNTQASSQSDLESKVKASGIDYEPKKYDYRIVDGKVQRKLKDK